MSPPRRARAVFTRTRPAWLMNDRANLMELDGYNEELGIAFEHNGRQHYEIDGYLVTNAAQLRMREDDDAAKARICEDHGVALVVVPWDVPEGEIQELTTRYLRSKSITIPMTDDFGSGISAPSVLREYAQFAVENGGQLLSDRYSGADEKLLWKCANPDHPPCRPRRVQLSAVGDGAGTARSIGIRPRTSCRCGRCRDWPARLMES